MHNFRKLHIWNDAMDIAQRVYELTGKFPPEEVFNLTSQARKSAVSIPSNIAEGAGRNTNGEFNQFLGHSTGSSYELETQLLLGRRLNYLSDEELEPFLRDLHILQKQVYKFKNSLKR